jgi:hypothetical protein
MKINPIHFHTLVYMTDIQIWYFLVLISSTIFLFLFAQHMTMHGHLKGRFSKNSFRYFYGFAVLFYFFYSSTPNVFLFLIARRFIESCVFVYCERSRMSLPQMGVGFSYYTVLTVHLHDKEIEPKYVFIILNLFQAGSHYLVFKRKIYVLRYSHYLCEFIIYLFLFFVIRSWVLFLNLMWIITFVSITIYNREKILGKTC